MLSGILAGLANLRRNAVCGLGISRRLFPSAVCVSCSSYLWCDQMGDAVRSRRAASVLSLLCSRSDAAYHRLAKKAFQLRNWEGCRIGYTSGATFCAVMLFALPLCSTLPVMMSAGCVKIIRP